MKELVFAEYQKLKRIFTKKIVLLAPIAIMFLCANLNLGDSFQKGSYNWWSSFILPGALTLICANVIEKDKKKMHYRGILSLPINPAKIWAEKIGTCVFQYLISCMVFFAGVTLGGIYYGSSIPLMQSAAGSALLFITFLWQIPLCMFLTDRMGLFLTVFINLTGNILCATFASRTSHWWIPYAVPARLMCPVIKDWV